MRLDTLQRFIFEDYHVRGEFVRLHATFAEILKRKEYPESVKPLIAQSLAIAALLSATLKSDRTSLIIQAQTDGPVNMLVAQCYYPHQLRATAQWDEEKLKNASALLGKGQLVITIRTGENQYQGVVAIENDNLIAAVEHYFAQSEQLGTRLWFAMKDEYAVGFLLQEIPGAPEGIDPWEHVTILANTITEKELLECDNTTILRRLFNEEDIRLFDHSPVYFKCQCDKEKMLRNLTVLPKEEAQELLVEYKEIVMTCDFCGYKQHFDAVDVEAAYRSKTN